MLAARAVVIPFGVPAEGRGLGLGLAALLHSFAQIDGQSVALAQLLGKSKDAEPGEPPSPVEAFVPPQAWRDLAGTGNAPPDVGIVLTGAFEPPSEGRGLLQLMAFDARDGRTRARVEAHIDGLHAGQTILAVFDELWEKVGGELGVVRDIRDLGWEALESVLRAERCALHDPARGGPHDRLAAMLHLGRAIGDAPEARFPAGRLAAIALDSATSVSSTASLAEAALRALMRASHDAPRQIDLLEASAVLHVRAGNPVDGEARACDALEQAPERTRLYALVSEARRARGNLVGALEAVDSGLLRAASDGVLCTERGVVLAEQGHLVEAEAAWRGVLSREPLHVPAFSNLAALVLKRGDHGTAQELVDRALVGADVHPEILRRAIQLVLATESEGIARAARLASLTRALLARTPHDAGAALVLARALAETGERSAAAERLSSIEALAPQSAIAAEAQRGRFSLNEPQAATELEAVLRAAYSAQRADLEVIASRGRRLAELHNVWSAWFAVGIAERRRGHWMKAQSAFESALGVAAGSTPAHMELVAVFVALGDPERALRHAERSVVLEGETARTLAVRATALLACGRRDEAQIAIDKAVALDTTDEANRALGELIRGGDRRGAATRVKDTLVRWLRPLRRGPV